MSKKSKPTLAYERVYIDIGEIMPMICECISSGKSVRIPIKGTSMLPLLREGRDSAVLSACGEPSRGDVVLYRRENGDYVLHRIIAVNGDSYTMCGDNQHIVERGIRRDHIIAVMTSYYKGEREMRTDSLSYKLYCAWRVFIRRAKNLLLRIRKRLFGASSARGGSTD